MQLVNSQRKKTTAKATRPAAIVLPEYRCVAYGAPNATTAPNSQIIKYIAISCPTTKSRRTPAPKKAALFFNGMLNLDTATRNRGKIIYYQNS